MFRILLFFRLKERTARPALGFVWLLWTLFAAGVVFSHQPSLFGNGLAVSVLSTAAGK